MDPAGQDQGGHLDGPRGHGHRPARGDLPGALPPAHMPRLMVTGFGVTYPEDPTVLGQRRRLALPITDHEA
eukprot:9520388-Alexandrium_andersonii.AAC.1